MLILVEKYLKDKRILIAAGVAALALVLIVVGVLMLTLKGSNNVSNQAAAPTEVPVLTLQPGDIGLTLVEAANMQTATMTITKTEDITSVDYQLSYNAEVSGQSIPRGTIGHVDVKTPGQTITQKMVFGTCSDVCHYDIGITAVQLIVKVTKTDGKIYQVQLTPAAQ
ncbi:MAG TPA: hypothetical protein VMR77_04170 [Patescibacteria group bacterium]|nr:hypothetical protein [Patescibacteria group bacterium]